MPRRSVTRPGERRLTVALDGEKYKRLRYFAAATDRTHQSVLEEALDNLLSEANPETWITAKQGSGLAEHIPAMPARDQTVRQFEGLGHYADLRNGGLVDAPRRVSFGAKLFLWCLFGAAWIMAGALAVSLYG